MMILLVLGQQFLDYIVAYFYSLDTEGVDELYLDEIVSRMMQQARISTRMRPDRWELKVSADKICIRFMHKNDRDDFLNAFDTESREVLKRHGLKIDYQYQYPWLQSRSKVFLLPDCAPGMR